VISKLLHFRSIPFANVVFFLVEGAYIHSKGARTAAASVHPAGAARPALMGRAAHSVEAKAVVCVEVAVRPRPCLLSGLRCGARLAHHASPPQRPTPVVRSEGGGGAHPPVGRFRGRIGGRSHPSGYPVVPALWRAGRQRERPRWPVSHLQTGGDQRFHNGQMASKCTPCSRRSHGAT
jgi:hypothetical protein